MTDILGHFLISCLNENDTGTILLPHWMFTLLHTSQEAVLLIGTWVPQHSIFQRSMCRHGAALCQVFGKWQRLAAYLQGI